MPRGIPRNHEPREWVLMKRCSRCKELKPWAMFSPGAYWPDGTMRRPTSMCKRCLAKQARVRLAKYRRRHPNKARDYQREWARRRRAALRHDKTANGIYLPAEPFKKWLCRLETRGENLSELSRNAGLDKDTLTKILKRNNTVSLFTVDAAMTTYGEHPRDIYGDEYERPARAA